MVGVNKFDHASSYHPAFTEQVRSTCLLVATRLHDFMQEDLVIVGGLVPTLLGCGPERHVGTTDVDIGLSIAIKQHQRYEAIVDRLRAAGFEPAEEGGRRIAWRWVLPEPHSNVKVEWLISAEEAGQKGGRTVRLSEELDALAVSGLELAFRDRERITLEGETPRNVSTSLRQRISEFTEAKCCLTAAKGARLLVLQVG